jgi:hypothetical protein
LALGVFLEDFAGFSLAAREREGVKEPLERPTI